MTNLILSTLMVGIYGVLFLGFFRGAIAIRSYWKTRMAVTVLLMMATGFVSHQGMSTLGLVVFFVTVWLLFLLVLQTTPMVALFAGSLFAISVFSSRSIVIGIMVFLLRCPIKDIMQDARLYYSALGSAIALSGVLWFMVRRFLADGTKLKQLFDNREQLQFVVLTHMILMMFLLLVHDGLRWDLRRTWFETLFLFSGVLCKATSIFVFNHALRVSVLLEYELHTRQMKEQLTRQMQHYESYQKFTESFRAFRHDYNHMMETVRTLMRNRDFDNALRLLDQIGDSMKQTVSIHQTYSNHVVLDAILQDAANACRENQIRFKAAVPVPEQMPLDALDTVRLFTNVVNNAVEACVKVPEAERFFEIRGCFDRQWIQFEATNSYDGQPLQPKKHGVFRTAKPDCTAHGYGLGIIRNIVTDAGGIMLLDADTTRSIFSIRISIPRAAPTAA